MVKTNVNGDNVPPFLAKLYEMVDDQSTNHIISWNQSSDSFVIWDMTEFSRDLLPKYFKHSNFSSFMRQLNIYGFRKVDTDRWEFANQGFIKDQKHLLSNIIRRRQPHGLAQQKYSQEKEPPLEASEEVDYTNLQKEVETLKTDKNVLMQELVKLRERQATSQNKLLVLRERLHGMEKNQQQMLSFLVMVMQSPGLLVQLYQPQEGNWRMAEAGKITLQQGTEDGKTASADGVIIRYQLPSEEGLKPASFPDPEKNGVHDLLFDGVKDLSMNIDFPPLPMEENPLSSDNCGSFILPELDLGMLEQFLLSSPSGDDSENAELHEEKPFISAVEIESILSGIELDNSQPTQTYESLCMDGSNQSQNLEVLTEQLGHLSPGRNSNKGEMM
ncbi:hypothetical protein Nepgr_028112 [Nepenthes gracilis]|uniref:HSF-type DNA-binding domain-containing protein n=1 Tax=Nepenthes gracilis TaxID=150966 RepID=A0AAD3TC77_NEPGR|nr:hypothetical protein Nepgr_028112 [Nepenthes gracilis]